MLVYRCEDDRGDGMYSVSVNHELCKTSHFVDYYGLYAIRHEFDMNHIEFDGSRHTTPRFCFKGIILDATIYSDDVDTRENSIFGFSSTSQLFDWLDDANVLYCLQNVFGIKIVVYEVSECYDGGRQCIFDRRFAKKHDEFHIDEFYRLHQCETIFNPVNQKVIELCRL